MKKEIDRRKFVKTTLAGTAALTLAPGVGLASSPDLLDPKGLPTRNFGRHGFKLPRSRSDAVTAGSKEMTWIRHWRPWNTHTGKGVYYWDTAAQYEDKSGTVSEELIGRILPQRRKEVFLVSKVQHRDADGAKELVERSLKRMKTRLHRPGTHSFPERH